MAIQFVGGNTAGKVGAASGNTTIALNSGLTGGIAASVSAGDLVIAAFAVASSGDVTIAITDGTNPYTLIDSELFANDSTDTNLRVAYKFMGGTPDTTTTFGPTTDAAYAGAMAVYVFRGVDSSTPLDVAAVPATGIDTSRANPAGITPTTAGAFGVFVGAAGHTGGVDTFTSSDLTDFLTVGANDTVDITIGIGHIDNWTSGEINPAAFGHSQADSVGYSWAAMSIALRPAADTVDDLLANDVSSASSVGTPVIGQAHVLGANDVASASSVSTPAVGQVHALLADDVASASSVTEPAIALVTPLLAEDVASASSVSVPAIGQVHALTADDVVSASSVTEPALGHIHVLFANSVASASTVGSPVLAEETGDTPRRGGDDAGSARPIRQRRKYRHITARQLQDLLEVKPEETPTPTHKRVRAVKREIVRQIEAEGLLGPAKPAVSKFVQHELTQAFVPSMDWAALAAAVRGIMQRAAEEAARIEQEIEDEDEFLILMAA